MTINKIRNVLYAAARIPGDVNAVKKGKIGERIFRRLAGKVSSRIINKIVK